MRRRGWLTNVIGVLVALIACFFLGRSLYGSWSQIRTTFATLHFHWWLIPVPFVFGGMSFMCVAYAWQLLLATFGEKLPLKNAVQILAYSNFGRYVPGKVWAVLGRVYMAKRVGVEERHSAASVIIETAFLLISALGLFVFSMFFYPALFSNPKARLLLILLPVTLALLYPPVFNRFVNFLLVRVKQPPIEFKIGIGRALLLFLVYSASWLALGLGLYFLTLSFYPVSPKALLIFPGAFSLSWIIGFLAIIVPGGLGVREWLFAVALEPIISGGMNTVVSVLSRIWISLVEILFFLVVLLFLRGRPADFAERAGSGNPGEEPPANPVHPVDQMDKT